MKKLFYTFLLFSVFLILITSPFQKETFFIVYAIGNPDSYGNVILWHTVEQHNGSQWVILLNHTSASNWSIRVEHDTPTRFQIEWRLNNTLAISESDAIDYTRIYMSITGIWTNQELNNTSSSSDASYYYGIELGTWNQTGYPQSGVTYDVQTKYEAYY